MPELAEVEFYRQRWHRAAAGERVVKVRTHDRKKLLRDLDLPAFRRTLTGARLLSSAAAAKQMVFRFSGQAWLGIHLGMSGELSVAPPTHAPGRHDHLVLFTTRHALVFSDPRMFGRIQTRATAPFGAMRSGVSNHPNFKLPIFNAQFSIWLGDHPLADQRRGASGHCD